jgi:ribose transport system permease protein
MPSARTTAPPDRRRALRRRLPSRRSGPFGAIWPATLVLFACSPLLAAGSLSSDAISGMLPFAAVLAIAAIGQTLVVQQRGLDLSVPGTLSLAAVIVTKYPNMDNGRLVAALLVVALAAAAVGAINGLAVTVFGVSPIVATLAVNSLSLGAVQKLSGGFPTGATGNLNHFALAKTAGIPNTVIIATILVVLIGAIVGRTVAGRRFQAVGDSPRAARAAGVPVFRYQVTTYIAASLCYATAGVLLAGYVKTPGIFVGDSYLLPSVAAVVLGGTSLAGGIGSVVASAGGALFLTQVDQVVLAMGAADAAQYLIQGAIIAVGMGVRAVPWRRLPARVGRGPSAAPAAALAAGGSAAVEVDSRSVEA